MPDLSEHNEDKPLKALLVGRSGSGKTGAVGCLASAGYNIRYLDFDNGIDIAAATVKGVAQKRFKYVDCTDGMVPNVLERRFQPKGMPTGYQTAVKSLDSWPDCNPKEGLTSHGDVKAWGQETVLVIDSLTMFGEAAMRLTLHEVGRKKPEIQDWYAAQNKVTNMLAMIMSKTVKCHVLVLAHIQSSEDAFGRTIEEPASLGKALPPKIPAYFNTMLLAAPKGQGAKAERMIWAKAPIGTLQLKCPWELPDMLPQATALRDIFIAAGKKPPKLGGA